MGAGFPPLDESLALVPGHRLTPTVVAGIVRLGVLVPFAQVPPLIAHFTGITVDTETVRRLTEAAGAIQEAQDTAAVAHLEQALPDPPGGPAVQLLSVDGAMVSLVDGTWREVKTLALGTVSAPAEPATPVQTHDLSCFSRLTDAATFNRLATIETQRRGTETAQTVVAVVDGAAWCQGFIDHQRHDAVRILDFAHALAHLSAVAQARYGPGTPVASAWLGQQAYALRHGQEAAVIDRLATLAETGSDTGSDEVRAVTVATHAYLRSRVEQIRYQTFVSAGYPIGSGGVESANKLVVEARLKGSGMHWRPGQVNPMLALRTIVANQCWDATWPDLWTAWRQPTRRHAADRRPRREAARHADTPPAAVAAAEPPPSPAPPADPLPSRPKTVVDGKPTADHPWRRA